MDTQQMLGVLLNTTEQQSQTTAQLLAALKEQIETLNAATQGTQKAASLLEQSAKNAAPSIQKATSDAVSVAMRDTLSGASETAVAALEAATKPILSKLSSVVKAAGEAEGKLTNATASFGWKWAMFASMVAAGAIITVLVVAWGMVWYQRSQVESLVAQKAALEADVSDLQANVVTLEKKGGRIRINTCGGRLCIEASSNQGAAQDGTALSLGRWTDHNGKVPLVIPRGY